MWGRQSLSFGEEGKSKESHNNNNQCNCIADYEQSVRINSSDIVYECNRNAKCVHIITNVIYHGKTKKKNIKTPKIALNAFKKTRFSTRWGKQLEQTGSPSPPLFVSLLRTIVLSFP